MSNVLGCHSKEYLPFKIMNQIVRLSPCCWVLLGESYPRIPLREKAFHCLYLSLQISEQNNLIKATF